MTGENHCACGCGVVVAGTWAKGHNFRGVWRNSLESRYVEEDRGYDTGCWIWKHRLTPDGYGQMWYRGRARRAHRVFYEVYRGEIASGLVLDHLCRQPVCVNPDHLEPVTNTENLHRGNSTTLTAEQVHEIRRLYATHFAERPLTRRGTPRIQAASGVVAGIAEQFGVSPFTIIGIVKEKTWIAQ